jgi:hypothetical protein
MPVRFDAVAPQAPAALPATAGEAGHGPAMELALAGPSLLGGDWLLRWLHKPWHNALRVSFRCAALALREVQRIKAIFKAGSRVAL